MKMINRALVAVLSALLANGVSAEQIPPTTDMLHEIARNASCPIGYSVDIGYYKKATPRLYKYNLATGRTELAPRKKLECQADETDYNDFCISVLCIGTVSYN